MASNAIGKAFFMGEMMADGKHYNLKNWLNHENLPGSET